MQEWDNVHSGRIDERAKQLNEKVRGLQQDGETDTA